MKSRRGARKRLSAVDFKDIEVTDAMLQRYDRMWETQKRSSKATSTSKAAATSTPELAAKSADEPAAATTDRKPSSVSTQEDPPPSQSSALSTVNKQTAAEITRKEEEAPKKSEAVEAPMRTITKGGRTITARDNSSHIGAATSSSASPSNSTSASGGYPGDPAGDVPFRKKTDEEAWAQMKAISRSFIKPPSMIIENFLYMGGVKNFPAMEKKPFDFEEFTHVVFALNNPTDKSPYPHEEGFHVAIVDKLDEDITPWFEPVTAFIDAAVKSHGDCARVLIHCMHGRSRSGSLTIAYFMHHQNCTLKEAFKAVCTARPDAKPNVAFCYQLMAYECKVKNRPCSSLTMREIKKNEWATALWALDDPQYTINRGTYKGV